MTHYERLGIQPSATATEIRDAYRLAARRAHPDRHGEGSSARMAVVNEAYRVLSDPARRRRYDDDLRLGTEAGSADSAASAAAARSTETERVPTGYTVAEHHAPARFPWRFLLAMGMVGVAVVLIGVILDDPPAPRQVDNILRPGDCVTLSISLEAAEASCDGPHDATVQELVPFDGTCPSGSEPFRDRQGMGTACVVRVDASASTARGPVGALSPAVAAG